MRFCRRNSTKYEVHKGRKSPDCLAVTVRRMTRCKLSVSPLWWPVEQADGVPVVFEQKKTILWECLYLLASLKDSPGLGGAYEANRRGGEENPVHGRNTTVNVDKIRGFRETVVTIPGLSSPCLME